MRTALVASLLACLFPVAPSANAEALTTTVGFQIGGTNGFDVTVIRGGRYLELTARRAGAEAYYLTKVPLPAAGVIQADLSSLARKDRNLRGPWVGDLNASFPGAASVPLAGPSVSATMDYYRYE